MLHSPHTQPSTASNRLPQHPDTEDSRSRQQPLATMPRSRTAHKVTAKASSVEARSLSLIGSENGHIGHFDFDYILRPPTCPKCGQNLLCCNCSGHKEPASKHKVVDVSNPVKPEDILEACTQVRIPRALGPAGKHIPQTLPLGALEGDKLSSLQLVPASSELDGKTTIHNYLGIFSSPAYRLAFLQALEIHLGKKATKNAKLDHLINLYEEEQDSGILLLEDKQPTVSEFVKNVVFACSIKKKQSDSWKVLDLIIRYGIPPFMVANEAKELLETKPEPNRVKFLEGVVDRVSIDEETSDEETSDEESSDEETPAPAPRKSPSRASAPFVPADISSGPTGLSARPKAPLSKKSSAIAGVSTKNWGAKSGFAGDGWSSHHTPMGVTTHFRPGAANVVSGSDGVSACIDPEGSRVKFRDQHGNNDSVSAGYVDFDSW